MPSFNDNYLIIESFWRYVTFTCMKNTSMPGSISNINVNTVTYITVQYMNGKCLMTSHYYFRKNSIKTRTNKYIMILITLITCQTKYTIFQHNQVNSIEYYFLWSNFLKFTSFNYCLNKGFLILPSKLTHV